MFNGSGIGRITAEQQGDIFVERRTIWIKFQSAAQFEERLLFLSLAGCDRGEQRMEVRVVRINREHGICLSLRLAGLTLGEQEVSKVDPRPVILRLQLNRTGEFDPRLVKSSQMLVDH